MKVTVSLAPNQQEMIVQLDKLDDRLGTLIDYIVKLANKARAAGDISSANELSNFANTIQDYRSDVEGDELKIIDDSAELKQALKQITQANHQITAAIEQSDDLDKSLKQIATIIDLVSKGLSLFSGA